MPNIHLIAKIKAKPEHTAAIQAGLSALVQPTLQEAGCIKYDLHQDLKDPSIFFFVEEWESEAHLKAHSSAAHIQAFGAKAQGKIESRELHLVKKG